MPLKTRHVPFSPQDPYRAVRPATSKIIFLSFEGSVTEEEYFIQISSLFSEIKSKIQFISVAEDSVHTNPRCRTPEQVEILSKARPKQLVERIDQFKAEKNNIYQFDAYPDDEFWIVTDVDENWESLWIEEWNEAIAMCQEKQYGYAISNPFFEIWLLLHHDNPTDEDKAFAVTESHSYQKTSHFRDRLRNLGKPLTKQKHIKDADYTIPGVMAAMTRAEALHIEKSDLCPKYFATTVYLLLNKLLEMLPGQIPDVTK